MKFDLEISRVDYMSSMGVPQSLNDVNITIYFTTEKQKLAGKDS